MSHNNKKNGDKLLKYSKCQQDLILSKKTPKEIKEFSCAKTTQDYHYVIVTILSVINWINSAHLSLLITSHNLEHAKQT